MSCILSIYMVALGCNESERVGDIALMFTRIGVQVMRLVLIVRKYGRPVAPHLRYLAAD